MLAFASMDMRREFLLRSISVLLGLLMAFSAQAWASHIDWPAAGDSSAHASNHAHSNTDSEPAAPDTPAQAESHSDHCSHAGAHLMGLRSCMSFSPRPGPAVHTPRGGDDYTSLIHPPLIDPPIV